MLWIVFIVSARVLHFLQQDGHSYIEAAQNELSKIQDRQNLRI